MDFEKALEPSYLRPQDTSRLVTMVGILESNNLQDKALEYALRATTFNPESFDSWRALYTIQKSSQEQKKISMENMLRLDPHNPELDKL